MSADRQRNMLRGLVRPQEEVLHQAGRMGVHYSHGHSARGVRILLLLKVQRGRLPSRQIIALRCLYGENRHNCGGITSNIYFYTAIVFWCLGGLYLSFMAFYFNEINLVVGIMGAALKVTAKTAEIKSAPVVSGLSISGICILLVWVLVESASIGQIRKITATSRQ